MSDEAAADHSEIVVLSREGSTDAPGDVVTDYTAVPRMVAALELIHDAAISRQQKQILTVVAMHHVATLGGWPDPRAGRQVLDLLPSRGAKLWRDIMRGMVAAAVAWLRAAEMPPDAVTDWLDKLLKTNQQPFILGFTASEATRWFYDYSKELFDKKGKHGAAPAVFALHRPDPVRSITEDQAKKQAFEILQSARQLNPAPLARGGHG